MLPAQIPTTLLVSPRHAPIHPRLRTIPPPHRHAPSRTARILHRWPRMARAQTDPILTPELTQLLLALRLRRRARPVTIDVLRP